MVDFTTIILQFGQNGDKTGWTYIEIPADAAQEILPGNKKSFRVKGKLDEFYIEGVAVMPMGNGNFLLALNAAYRKGVGKRAGAILRVRLEHDAEFKIEVPEDLQECLEDEPDALAHFNKIAKSHRNYFIKWIDDAKTIETRTRRIVHTINALNLGWSYSTMIREQKKG